MILSKEIGESIGRQQSPPATVGRSRSLSLARSDFQCCRGETENISGLIEDRNDFRGLTPEKFAGFTNCLRQGNIVYVGNLGMRAPKSR
jgi:hypothetical protein